MIPNFLLINEDFNFVLWFQLLCSFTMYHLFKKDQLILAYFYYNGFFLFLMLIIRWFKIECKNEYHSWSLVPKFPLIPSSWSKISATISLPMTFYCFSFAGKWFSVFYCCSRFFS
jgi:hypothetical protein